MIRLNNLFQSNSFTTTRLTQSCGTSIEFLSHPCGFFNINTIYNMPVISSIAGFLNQNTSLILHLMLSVLKPRGQGPRTQPVYLQFITAQSPKQSKSQSINHSRLTLLRFFDLLRFAIFMYVADYFGFQFALVRPYKLLG